MKTRYWIKVEGDNCPICNFKIRDCHVGGYCTNEDCPGSYVDGTVQLTKEQVKQYKDKLIKPWNVTKRGKD